MSRRRAIGVACMLVGVALFVHGVSTHAAYCGCSSRYRAALCRLADSEAPSLRDRLREFDPCGAPGAGWNRMIPFWLVGGVLIALGAGLLVGHEPPPGARSFRLFRGRRHRRQEENHT